MTLAEKLKDEGFAEGKLEGKLEGSTEKARNVLIVLAQDKFDFLNQTLINDLKSIESLEILDRLFMKTLSCESMEDFKNMVNKAKAFI